MLSQYKIFHKCHRYYSLVIDVVFIEGPQDVIVPCGSNMMAEFRCWYTYRGRNGTALPWWTIGSEPVGRILPEYDSSTMTLRVRNISVVQNNTAYTCEFQTQENSIACVYSSESGKIIITCEGNYYLIINEKIKIYFLISTVSEIQYEPHYQYISTSQPATLKSIVTTITQVYLITYYNQSYLSR